VVEGSPTNLSVPRTMKSSLGRRVALSAPIRREREAALAVLAEARARHLDALANYHKAHIELERLTGAPLESLYE